MTPPRSRQCTDDSSAHDVQLMGAVQFSRRLVVQQIHEQKFLCEPFWEARLHPKVPDQQRCKPTSKTPGPRLISRSPADIHQINCMKNPVGNVIAVFLR